MENSKQKCRANWNWSVVLVLILINILPLQAEVRLAGIFSSEMVLQRNHEIIVWGWADEGERISVSFNQLTKKTKADGSGKWKVVFPQMQAGGPYEMKVQGKNLIILNNILIGDIWICSGQSNMGFALKNANEAEKEIAAANYPSIRLVSVPRSMPAKPIDDIKSISWQACSPESVTNGY